ncbi:hypothetical protein [uncultured Thiocystis sp.]|jgi:hypothetical protein|uniref:hypothetical protein n=1 Tax=uncultured Thiocystis sp. TaxID=1202134 RepID=UPI0025D35BB2|nr:hypothetical protein [uncultured Thiocystis sp.]
MIHHASIGIRRRPAGGKRPVRHQSGLRFPGGNTSRTDGSQVDGTARVSSSWNSQTTSPRGGFYTLELGDSACGESVELYINGQSLGRHRLPSSGNVNVDFVLKGSSDTLVR